jgi:hypothetical protein
MTVHRIRLRGPWQLKATAADSPSSPQKIQLPAPWGELFDSSTRRVQLSRRFHRPTNLGPADRLSLVVDELPEGARVSLNGVSLGAETRYEEQPTVFPTPRLEPHNLLTVEFDVAQTTPPRGDLWGDVTLVISSP